MALCPLAVTAVYAAFLFWYSLAHLQETLRNFVVTRNRSCSTTNCCKMLPSYMKCLEMPWETSSIWSKPGATSCNITECKRTDGIEPFRRTWGQKIGQKMCKMNGERLPNEDWQSITQRNDLLPIMVGLHLWRVWALPLSSLPKDSASPRCFTSMVKQKNHLTLTITASSG